MTTQEQVESFTEWGVLWSSGYVQSCPNESHARGLAYLYRDGVVIRREVTRTEWTRVVLNAEGGDSVARADA